MLEKKSRAQMSCPVMFTAISGTEKNGHKTLRSPEQWPVRARYHWAEQSLRVPSLALAWAHIFALMGKEGPSMTLVEGVSNILLGLTFLS